MAKKEKLIEKTHTVFRISEEDKKFFNSNKLQIYLMTKHKRIIYSQEDLMNLIRLELQQNLENDKK